MSMEEMVVKELGNLVGNWKNKFADKKHLVQINDTDSLIWENGLLVYKTAEEESPLLDSSHDRIMSMLKSGALKTMYNFLEEEKL